jgi:hypothetical protein
VLVRFKYQFDPAKMPDPVRRFKYEFLETNPGLYIVHSIHDTVNQFPSVRLAVINRTPDHVDLRIQPKNIGDYIFCALATAAIFTLGALSFWNNAIQTSSFWMIVIGLVLWIVFCFVMVCYNAKRSFMVFVHGILPDIHDRLKAGK